MLFHPPKISRSTSNNYKIGIIIIKINECIQINYPKKTRDWFYFIDSDGPNYFKMHDLSILTGNFN